MLAQHLEEGIGAAVDLPAAVRWYAVAAEGGLGDAAWNLALCYKDGAGTAVEPPRRRAPAGGGAECARSLTRRWRSSGL